jgi:NarL family two-component system response regulator YdfI
MSVQQQSLQQSQPLSPIERSVVRALADGKQSKEIAQSLERSRATIEFYVRSLYIKLDAKSRAQIVARAFERGILTEGAGCE